jgi:hypothetical protein
LLSLSGTALRLSRHQSITAAQHREAAAQPAPHFRQPFAKTAILLRGVWRINPARRNITGGGTTIWRPGAGFAARAGPAMFRAGRDSGTHKETAPGTGAAVREDRAFGESRYFWIDSR